MSLSKQFQKRTVYKTYITAVCVTIREERGRIEAPLGRSQKNRKIIEVGPLAKKQAITEFKVLARTGGITLLSVRIITGRTHKIRSHMKYIGHPVLGDAAYGGSQSLKGTDDFQINTYIVGLKSGYEFKAGNYWIIEPNLSLIYGFYGVENHTTKQGAKVAEDSINNFRIEPQIKAKLDLVDGWKPYALLGYIYNTGKTSTQVNGNNKKEEGIDPYYEYGIGLEKNFIGTAWVGYAQVMGKTGGKKGVCVNLGIKYAF